MSGGITPTMNNVNLMEVKAKMAMPPMTMLNPRRNSAKVVVKVSPICAVSEATREFSSPTRFEVKNDMGKCSKWV